MKRFLFLDDDENRQKRFSEMIEVVAPKEALIWTDRVYTATECILYLETQDIYDAIFLDHDLHLNAQAVIDNETGMDVVNFITLHLEQNKWPRNIIIHSHNKEAADFMNETLWDMGFNMKFNLKQIEFPSFFAHTDKEFMDLLTQLIKE